jgi:hypothetical protein
MPVLEGRRIAPGASRGRKVRTPQGVMLRNPSPFDWDTRRRKVGRLSDGKCHRKLNRRRLFEAARVKRWCKRPPREAQATRHGKPHRVQGQIGNRGVVRSGFRESETGFGYRSLRQMILSTRKSEDRIRLTALPKPFLKTSNSKHQSPEKFQQPNLKIVTPVFGLELDA